VFRTSQEIRKIIELSESNEPLAILDILPFAVARRRRVAAAAADAIHKLLRQVSTVDLPSLDIAARQRSYHVYHFYDWYRLSPEQLERFGEFGDASISRP
jgi:hypothetical protein